MTDTLHDLYRDLHAHPELAFDERRTAAAVADRLRACGFAVTTGIGGTGVVGLLTRGEGSTVMLRAELDALPIREQTGLPYASEQRARLADGRDVGVMHACGHDLHLVALIQACHRLAAQPGWCGTVAAVCQPAEEVGLGARAMIMDGLLDLFERPAVVLGQHVSPAPIGLLASRPGPFLAAGDRLRIRFRGSDGHPALADLDGPVVATARFVIALKEFCASHAEATSAISLQTLDAGVRGGGSVAADTAEIGVELRTHDAGDRRELLARIGGLAQRAAAETGCAPPEVQIERSFPALVNDPVATARVQEAHRRLCPRAVVTIPPALACDDFAHFGAATGVPSVYWYVGGGSVLSADASGTVVGNHAVGNHVVGNHAVGNHAVGNHSGRFAPVLGPTLEWASRAWVSAACCWLGQDRGPHAPERVSSATG